MLPMLENLKVNILGTSHSSEIRLEIEGLPKGEKVDFDRLQNFTDRRKSANNVFSTPRKEADKIEILSGCDEGILDGKKFVAVVKNANVKSSDYSRFKATPRPGHADYTALLKYGPDADLNGGGQFSGRMTLALVIAGGIAAQILERHCGTEVLAYISEIGGVRASRYNDVMPDAGQIKYVQKKGLAVFKNETEILNRLNEIASAGDSAGGVIECIVFNPPLGIGGPFTYGLESRVSALVYSIPAVKGVEFGSGFEIARLTGSAANDAFRFSGDKVVTETNHNGGINGGISNGMPVTLRVAVKPVPSISKEQKTVDLENKTNTVIKIDGRHDACIVPRAVVCVEAAVALALADCLIGSRELK